MNGKRAAVFFSGVFIGAALVAALAPQEQRGASAAAERNSAPEGAMLVFVGDVMLARDVEMKMAEYGTDHPFMQVTDLLDTPVVVGNFEAAVPKRHVPTPHFGMRFSVKPDNAGALVNAGFTHLSLANNHADDFGASGYRSTVDTLDEFGLVPFGQPRSLDESSVSFVEIGGVRIALVGAYAVDSVPSDVEIEAAFKFAERGSEVQIAYVHWGNEYALTHNAEQERLAHAFVEAGADIVIGHHPHVVQDIGEYEGAPIFYSLGNFIFDQYFSAAVEEGLALRMKVGKDVIELTLVPLSSADSRTSPRSLVGFERAAFLANLANRSAKALKDEIRSGALSVSR